MAVNVLIGNVSVCVNYYTVNGAMWTEWKDIICVWLSTFCTKQIGLAARHQTPIILSFPGFLSPSRQLPT